jgi:hypothetical protein
MADEPQPKRAQAAWNEEREEVAKRNAAARKRAQTEQKTRAGALDDRLREDSRREREQLQALNARIEKLRSQ